MRNEDPKKLRGGERRCCRESRTKEGGEKHANRPNKNTHTSEVRRTPDGQQKAETMKRELERRAGNQKEVKDRESETDETGARARPSRDGDESSSSTSQCEGRQEKAETTGVRPGGGQQRATRTRERHKQEGKTDTPCPVQDSTGLDKAT